MSRTLILKWNPAISSYTMERFLEDLQDHMFYDFDWSVWEHEQLVPGDRFFLVRVGEGNTGIVMAGSVISRAYKGEDWSGKGRETYYAYLEIADAYDSDRTPIITTEQLQEAIPDFKWDGGHSGLYLTDQQSEALELLYENFRLAQIKRFAEPDDEDLYDDIEEDELHISLESRAAAPAIAELVRRTHGPACKKCGYDYRHVFGPDCPNLHTVYLLGDYQSDTLTTDDYHCLCANCRLAIHMEARIEK